MRENVEITQAPKPLDRIVKDTNKSNLKQGDAILEKKN